MINDKAWTWVCVQHPMPLLVQDRGTPDVLERIPPWGDPDLPSYLQKLKDVFDSLDRYPGFRMDFEISAREMEDVAGEDPRTVERMAALVREGKLGLIGGDYSQAHYHVYGPESCLRQISMGLKVFEKYFDYRIEIFFHQETGIHEQLPQILKAFGYRIAVPPRFPWAIRFLEGRLPELSSHYGTVEFLNGEEFVYWQGLDGTKIPLYLSIPAPSQSDEIVEVFQKHGNPEVRKEIFEGGPSPFDQFMERERQKHPVTVPPILIENPDMKRLTEEYYQKRSRHCRFSLMGPALKERLDRCPPASTARLYPYWSYIEGVWAEELSRANRRAETAAVQAETLCWLSELMTGGAGAGSSASGAGTRGAPERFEEKARLIESIWERILSSQHHDIYWIETTDLKRTALRWLEEAQADCRELARRSLEAIAEKADTSAAGGERVVVVFNTVAHRRGAVSHVDVGEIGEEGFRLEKLDGTDVPGQWIRLFAGQDTVAHRLLLQDEIPGLGYCSYALHPGKPAGAGPGERTDRCTFENSVYRAQLDAGGTFRSLFLKQAGREMLDTGEYLGNEIRGTLEGGERIGNRDVGAQAVWRRGPLADLFSSEYRLSSIPVWQNILFYHGSGRIDFFLTLDFGDRGTALGDFWNDREKLNVYWPFPPEAAVHHDIPFGVVEARDHRPLYCTNWIDASVDQGGVAYLNRGTTKHWLERGTIANVLAWGGNWFSNRHPGIWEYVRKYDIRLFGKHTLEYSLFAHEGDWRQGEVPLEAEAFAAPLRAASTTRHPGALPASDGVLELQAANVITTAVTRDRDPGSLHCRSFESCGRETSRQRLGARSSRKIGLSGFRADAIDTIRPYQIVEVRFGEQAAGGA